MYDIMQMMFMMCLYTVNLNKFRVLKTFDVTDYIIKFEYIYYYF